MSEWDVINWLVCKRIEGNEYYSTNEIHKGLISSGMLNGSKHKRCTIKKTWNLYRRGFFDRQEPKKIKDWSVKFRLKKKFIDNNNKSKTNNSEYSIKVEKC